MAKFNIKVLIVIGAIATFGLVWANDSKFDLIIGNQNKIMANQEAIIANQGKLDKILKNQDKLDVVIRNQNKLDQILRNQSELAGALEKTK